MPGMFISCMGGGSNGRLSVPGDGPRHHEVEVINSGIGPADACGIRPSGTSRRPARDFG